MIFFEFDTVFSIICIIISTVTMIIGLCNKKKLLSILSVILIFFNLSAVVICALFSLCYIPLLRYIVSLSLITTIVIIAISQITKAKIAARIIGIITLVIIYLGVLPLSLLIGCVYKNQDGQNYVGIYDEFTGIGESLAFYYKIRSGIFIEIDYTFFENYGFIFSSAKDMFEKEPYETGYNENKKAD